MFQDCRLFVARVYPRSIRHQHASAVFTLTLFQCASSSRIINCKVFSFLINLPRHPCSQTCRHLPSTPVGELSFCAQWLRMSHPVLYAKLSRDENTESVTGTVGARNLNVCFVIYLLWFIVCFTIFPTSVICDTQPM